LSFAWSGVHIFVVFIRPFKNGTYYGNTCGSASTGFPPFKSKSFHQVFVKLNVNMLVCIMAWPISLTSQIPPQALLKMTLKWSKIKVSLFKSKSVCHVCIKLGEYVGGHNISTMFYNQPNPPHALLHYSPWIVQN